MIGKSKFIMMIVGIGLVFMSALVLLAASQPTAAQTPTDTLRGLLLELDASNTQATLEFGQAVPRLGRSIDVGEGGVQFDRIGADMVCFVVRGTAVDQIGCVPYTNIVSVIYSERR